MILIILWSLVHWCSFLQRYFDLLSVSFPFSHCGSLSVVTSNTCNPPRITFLSISFFLTTIPVFSACSLLFLMLDNHLIPHSLKCLDPATCHCSIPTSCPHSPLLTQLLSHGYTPYIPLPFLCPLFFFLLLLFSGSVVSNSLWPHALQGFPVLHHLAEFAQSHVHWVSDTIQPSHPLLPPSPILSLSQYQGLFQWIGSIRWPMYWSFSFSISPSNEYSGFISFRIDWFDLLAIQGILKSLLQHHSSKASILQCSTFFMVQVSHPFTTTMETRALTIRSFVGKIMFLLFNMLSRFVIA